MVAKTNRVDGARTWRGGAGAWLGIGTSPGALVLGSQLSEHFAGPVPILALGLGLSCMGWLLYLQGRLGLARPKGFDSTFVALTRSHLSDGSRRFVGVAIALGMVGWVAFAIGIGAESLGRIAGLSQATGSVAIGMLVVFLAAKEVHKWNFVAVVTTVSTLMLAGLVVLKLNGLGRVLTTTAASPALTAGAVAALVGYVAVFAVRAPDFLAGMHRRRDVVISILLLLLPAFMLFLVGAGLGLNSVNGGESTLEGLTMIRLWSLPVGDLLVVLGTMAPGIVSAYSGGLAFKILRDGSIRTGIVVVTLCSTVLGALGFQQHLFPFLALLAGVLPPLIVPFSIETAFRRRGCSPRTIPWWTWVPASVFGGTLVAMGWGTAPLLGVGASTLLSAVFVVRRWRP